MVHRRVHLAVLAVALLAACDGSTGPVGATGPIGPPGDDGPQGPPGTSSDGGAALRLYGDGRDGALNVPSGTSTYIPLTSVGQFTTITIETGGTLLVHSGTLLRATGDVDNDGTILVLDGAMSGVRRYGSSLVDLAPAGAPAHPGIARSSAEFGSVDLSATFFAYGGIGGQGVGDSARWMTQLLPVGGGGGADSWPFASSAQESGGGSVHIRSGGEIRSAGTIRASGVTGQPSDCGLGGGGGGVVLLAAATRIDNGGGVIDVKGGNGIAHDGNQCGSGGGGGGGIVHLIAPEIVSGDLQIAGGAAGATGTYGSTRWIAGSGGGGSAGNGGRGYGRIGVDVTEAVGGTIGRAYQITGDPASVL